MYVRLSDFISHNNILSPHQYGFRAKRSTYMVINDLYCRIAEDLDNKLNCLGIFLDLSKAFDTLNHTILLEKPLWYQGPRKYMDRELPLRQEAICCL